MQQNTTDLIAKSAWDATKTYWKEFIVLPFIVGLVALLIEWLIISQIKPGIGSGILSLLIAIALLVFALAYSTAILKWCSEIYAGKKELDIEAGVRYGLSRFWGVLGTGFLTGIKIFLWTLLLIVPGLYKMVQYSQSIKVSQLEKISGGKANQMSEKVVMKAGFLRTIGNLMAINTVTTVILYVVIALIYLVAAILLLIKLPFVLIGIVVGSAALAVFLLATTFMVVFSNFQYLYYRDEQKDMMGKTAKAMEQI